MRHNGDVSFELCEDSSAARWLLDQDLPWYHLAARGPIGFEKYLRLLFIPDPDFRGQRTNDVEFEQKISELAQVGVALDVLSRYTTTPDECYFALWDGWSSIDITSPPKFKIADRDYFLFRGSLTDYEIWSSEDPLRWPYGESPDPAFIWPVDRAWCITNDVDPHFATVAGSAEAIDHVLAETAIDTVADDPDVHPPHWN